MIIPRHPRLDELPDGSIRVCRGNHLYNEACEWEAFVPKEPEVSPLLGKYLNEVIAKFGLKGHGAWFRELFARYETEAHELALRIKEAEKYHNKAKQLEETENLTRAIEERERNAKLEQENLANLARVKSEPRCEAVITHSDTVPTMHTICDRINAHGIHHVPHYPGYHKFEPHPSVRLASTGEPCTCLNCPIHGSLRRVVYGSEGKPSDNPEVPNPSNSNLSE